MKPPFKGVGRPVAYYPKLARAVGDSKAGIFLCQLIYWTGKGDYENGWLYKTSQEMEVETGLSYREQRTARKRLLALGILEEEQDRLRHRMWFRVKIERLEGVLVEWTAKHPETGEGTDESAVPGLTEAQSGKCAKRSSGNDESAVRTNSRDYNKDDTQNTDTCGTSSLDIRNGNTEESINASLPSADSPLPSSALSPPPVIAPPPPSPKSGKPLWTNKEGFLALYKKHLESQGVTVTFQTVYDERKTIRESILMLGEFPNPEEALAAFCRWHVAQQRAEWASSDRNPHHQKLTSVGVEMFYFPTYCRRFLRETNYASNHETTAMTSQILYE